MNNGEQFFNTSGGGGYAIERSLRFNSSDSAYLSRTPASAGNRKTWTWAGWVKRCSLATRPALFSNIDASNNNGFVLNFLATGELQAYEFGGSTPFNVYTTSVYRDSSAWYHVVFVLDTTDAVAFSRTRMYVNGVQSTLTTAVSPSLNYDGFCNNTQLHAIGRQGSYPANYLDGYLANIHFCDGYAYDPSYFTEFDDNGILQPKAFTGSYGTNGFHLDFADNSTAAALGTDTSGNGNDWTVNNIWIGSAGLTTVSNLAVYGNQQAGNIANAFDGNVQASEVFWGRPNNFGATFDAVTANSSVRVFASSQSGSITINQSINTGLNSAYPTFAWLDVSSSLTFPFTLTAVGYSGGSSGDGGGFSAVEVDGKILATAAVVPSLAAGNDSLVDVPTNGTETDTGVGGEVRGNYATWNPLSTTAGTFTQGNLRFTGPGNWRRANATTAVSTGQWYWEVTLAGAPFDQSSGGAYHAFGFGVSSSFDSATGPGSITDALVLTDTGWYKNFTGSLSNASGTFTTNSVLSIAIDLDANTFEFRHNNSSLVTGTIGGTAGRELVPIIVSYDALYGIMDCNFGQRPFAYTAPSGFKALNTANLPAPVVTKPSEYMDIALYTGNGGTQSISGLEFSPDLVWIKEISGTKFHALCDSVRGDGLLLYSNSTLGEQDIGSTVVQLATDGFNLGFNSAYTAVSHNWNGITHAAWTWDAGSSTVSNTDGSITSSVRANPSAGFSIVTYTASGTAGATVGHGLGVAPQFIIVKNRDYGQNWFAYHQYIGGAGGLNFNTTQSAFTSDGGYWNSTNPSSSVITLGNYHGAFGTHRYVAYCFAPVDGYSAFGSYTGNGSADGPFVYTGFRPKFVLIKTSSIAAQNWYILDSARDLYNLTGNKLEPNTSNQENASPNNATTNSLDFLSNGFKLRTGNDGTNQSSATYIYAAFAESPFQYARAR